LIFFTFNEPGTAFPNSPIMYEVEMKFRVDDLAGLEKRLAQYGVEFGGEVEENDQFYQHPSRDFVRTDEALRLRRRRLPDETMECFLTYKGPKIDSETKTRREIEIPLPDPESLDMILSALGFRRQGQVRKFRRRGELLYGDRQFDILLDRLPVLENRGATGTFVELETLAEEENLHEARQSLLELAAELGLSESIRTSYLGLLQMTAHGNRERSAAQ